MSRILVLDREPSSLVALARLFASDGHLVTTVTEGHAAVAALARESYDVIVSDVDGPSAEAQAVLDAASLHQPHTCVVLTSTRSPGAHLASTCIKSCLFMEKPIDYSELVSKIFACPASEDHADCPHSRRVAELGR